MFGRSNGPLILVMVVLLVLTPFSPVLSDVRDGVPEEGGSSRAIIDKFNVGQISVTNTYHGDEVRRNSHITLDNNSYVDEATMLVRGLPRMPNTMEYPEKVEIDFGDDSSIEWAFMYEGAGKMGYQDLFYNETIYNSFSVDAGVEDDSTTIRLPLNATVTRATLNLEGRFRSHASLLVNGTEVGEEMGWSVTFAGDLDGDTWPDFAVAAPNNDTATNTDAGRVFVFFGGASLDADPDLTLSGVADNDEFGYNIRPAGDVNNDGYDDLLVGVPYSDTGNTNAGRVYIFYGGDPMDSTPDVIMTGVGVGDWFGFSANGVGDVNNDGYDDIVSTSPNWRYNIGESTFIHGRMYLYLGGDPMDNVSDLDIQGPSVQNTWGWAVSPAGDVDNDGYDDWVLGSYNNDDGCSDCGRVDLFLGAAVPDGTMDLTMTGSGGEQYGYSMASLGDINKDNFDDFLIGAIANQVLGAATGAAYVYFGGDPVDSTADLTLHGTGQGDWFSSSLSSAGDINNDGWLDIVVGAEMNDSTTVDSGGVFIFFGNGTLDNETDLYIPGKANNDRFGRSVSGGTDINKDGYSDVLVGAFLNDAKANNGGRAYLMTTVPKKAVNPVLDLTGSADPPGDIWNRSGTFFDNVTIPDFSLALNQYLGNATDVQTDDYGNEYVDISLGVTSDNDAEFVISNLSIYYDWDAVVGINPTGTLQEVLDSKIPHLDTGTTKVTIWSRSRSKGKVMFHSLNVVTDDGPTVTTIPSFSLDEDTIDDRVVDLHDHFDDDNDPDDFLTYSIVSFTNNEYVNVTLNDSHFVSVDAFTGDLNDNWTGSTQVVVNATDTRGLVKRSDTFTIDVIEVNDRPLFTSEPVLQATATRPYSYQATAIDDGGSVTFHVQSGPSGMTIDGATGEVSWTPSDVGTVSVALKVTDGELDDLQNFTIEVAPPNDPPKITSTPLTTAIVGIHYTYQLTATDPDGDDLTAELTAGPVGMALDDDWRISYIPGADQVGDRTVTLTVSDGKVSVGQTYTLTVTKEGMNNVPFFVSKPGATAVVGHTYEYKMVAQDDDRDILSFGLDRGPEGMMVDGDLLEWVPAEDQVGEHEVITRVSDGMAFSLQDFTVSVLKTGMNHAPVIVSTPPSTAKVGYTYEYQVEARDDDLDKLTYSLDVTFKRMTVDEATGLLIWHPASDSAGNQTITVRVSDGMGFDTQTFVVTVDAADKNGLPIFLSTPPTNGKVGVNYSYQPQVQDPDMDPVTFVLAEGPEGMTIGQTTGLISWVPAQGQVGNWTVEIRASDGKGFSVQRFTVHVEAQDITKVLTIRIIHPMDGTRLSGTITIDGTASVNVGEIFEVQVSIDGGKWNTADGLDTWEFVLNTSTLKNGPHTIAARAWDGDTYSDTMKRSIKVENKDPEDPDEPITIFGMDAPFFLLILVVLILLIVGIAFAMKASGQSPPPAGARRRPRDEEPRRPRERRPSRREEDRYDDRDDDGYDDEHDDGYEDEYEDEHDDGYDDGHDDEYDREREYDDGY